MINVKYLYELALHRCIKIVDLLCQGSSTRKDGHCCSKQAGFPESRHVNDVEWHEPV